MHPQNFNTLRRIREQDGAVIQEEEQVQQTVATAIQGYLNHPDVNRAEAIELIKFLNQPMLAVQIKALRGALRAFKAVGQAKQLIEEVRQLRGMLHEMDCRAIPHRVAQGPLPAPWATCGESRDYSRK